MAYVIAEPCLGTKDAACVEVCPCDCIHPRPDEAGFEEHTMLHIDPDPCIDCDLCATECPVRAIFPAAELPEEWRHYEKINAEHFGRTVD